MQRYTFVSLSLLGFLVTACGAAPPAATSAPAASAVPTEVAASVAARPKASAPAIAGMDAVLSAYLDEADRLAADTYEATAATKLKAAADAVAVDPPPAFITDLRMAASVYAAAADIASARRAFDAVSTILIEYAEAHETAAGLHLVHCPMVQAPLGGSWLQRGDTVRNPWYGSGMLTCGVKKW